MSILQAITAPFSRFFARLRRVSEKTYCGDTSHCEGLNYAHGNVNQAEPPRAATLDSEPVQADEIRKPANYPSA